MKKRLLTLFLCIIMVLSSAICAFAAEGQSNIDGVLVKVSLSKESYEPGETVELNVLIKNNNDYAVSDVMVQYPKLPENIEFDRGSMKQKIGKLDAGASEVFTITGVVAGTPGDASSDEGSFPWVIVGIIAAVAVVIIVIVVVVVSKKKGKKAKDAADDFFAILLVLALGASSLTAAAPVMEVNAEVSEDTMVKNGDYKRVSVHDPSIVKDPETGMYYVFGSHLAWAKSEDLINWQSFKNNINSDFATLFGDIWNNYVGTAGGDLSGMMWAPDVIYNEVMGKWCMYMSINGNDWRSAIVLLTADNIEGPYTYVDEVVFSGFNANTTLAEYTDVYKVLGEGANLSRYGNTDISCINAIDPCITVDDNGDHWMTYGSWSAGIFQLKLDKSTGLRDYNYTYEDASNKSDRYLGYKIAGGFYNSGEGPYIFKAGDYYYLFVSLGNLETSGGYNMRVYRSESINGPYVDQKGKSSIFTYWMADVGYQKKEVTNKYNSSIGIKIFGSYQMYGINQIKAAQGHNSAFVDDDGKIYLIYHTRFAGTSEGHQVRVQQMFINEDGWLISAPYEYSNETLSTEGYSKDDICGTYEFIRHVPTLVYNYNKGNQYGIVGATGETKTSNVTKTFTAGGTETKFNLKVSFNKSGAKTITLLADGTVSGDYTGTWVSEDGVNVVLKLNDNIEYKGVFLKQQNELATRDVTMTFTVLGNNITAWGVRNLNAE